MLSDVELAWAAGFFDGEGSVHICHRGNKNGRYMPYPQVAISQSGELGPEPLLKFNKAVGDICKLYGPLKPAKNQKQIRYQLEGSGIAKTYIIYKLLKPWLGTVKRNKFEYVLNEYCSARELKPFRI